MIYELATKISAFVLLQKTKYKEKEKYAILSEIEKIAKQTEFQQTYSEGYNLVSAITATNHLNGDIAELGTYKGGSAKLITLFKGKNQKLHLFDTFDGMPSNNEGFSKEQFATSIEKVKELVGTDNVIYHKGFFPETATKETDDARYAFVHLDADIRQSILSGLKYFYPRMLPGGIIIIHDWGFAGVKSAFSEYFGERKPITFCHGTQAMVIRGDLK